MDNSALVHTAWDLGSPLNTVTWFFQIVGAEIRVIDCDSDLDLTPVQRVARMLNKGYLYGSHFLPHDAMATMNSGKTFLTELGEVGKVVPRTHDIWIGINRLRQILPRFRFRIPACERGLEAVSNYRTVRTTSTGLAVDEPVHDWSSHAASALKVVVGIQRGDFLNLRQGPGQNYPIVQRLENGVNGIKLIGNAVTSGGTIWQKIDSRGVQGWATAIYIAPDSKITASSRPAVARKAERIIREPKPRSSNDLPAEVRLTTSTAFPTFEHGVQTGLSAVPVETKVKLVKIKARNVLVEYQGQKKSIPSSSTDLLQRMRGTVED